jgi:predicted nucleic acid-binding Zn ribbon protein
VTENRPPRPSDIARAALEAARAASAARPQPTRRRIAGPRRKWTGPRPGEDDPQPLGRLVDSLVSDQDWSEHTRVGAVFGRWSALVGPDIAEHCRPQTLTEGELLVVAESTAWATQLRLMTPQILARITRELPAGMVTKLVVTGPSVPSWKRGPWSMHGGRGVRDTYG